MFTAMAHKEERFLFSIYPLVCLGSALSCTSVCAVAGAWSARLKAVFLFLVGAFFLISAIVSSSRIAALVVYYGAPLEVYGSLFALGNNEAVKPAQVCVGKEWYRFTSSFFVPEGAHLNFVKSAFDGQLPAPYAEGEDAMRIAHSYFNDENREDTSRYVDVSECDYMIDFAVGDGRYRYDASPTGTWQAVHCSQFVDAEKSRFPRRSFYVPRVFDAALGSSSVAYADYCLLQRATAEGGGSWF